MKSELPFCQVVRLPACKPTPSLFVREKTFFLKRCDALYICLIAQNMAAKVAVKTVEVNTVCPSVSELSQIEMTGILEGLSAQIPATFAGCCQEQPYLLAEPEIYQIRKLLFDFEYQIALTYTHSYGETKQHALKLYQRVGAIRQKML